MVQIRTYGAIPVKNVAGKVEETAKENLEAESSASVNFLHCEKSSFYLFVYVILYVLFLFTGAAIFSIMEGPEELSAKMQLETHVQAFLSRHPNVSYEALEKLLEQVVRANSNGISVLKNSSTDSNWNFGQSFFFTSTVVTTIGYGHVTPLSKFGKIFCIFYAMVGIPLTLVLITALVNRLLVPTIWLLGWLNFKLEQHYQSFNIRLIHLIIMVSILSLVFLIIPAGIFSYIEPEWDYLDSFYYCFISLTTIGLGDYIPGESGNQPYGSLYKILTAVFLFLGITFLMLTLTVFYDIPQLNLGYLFNSTENNNQKKKSSYETHKLIEIKGNNNILKQNV